jgi:phenol 2-monooxygenase
MLSDRTSNDTAAVQKYFVQHGRYTAGTATHYRPALLTGDSSQQDLARGFGVGTRFHSAPVTRIGDGRLMQLGTTLQADGRWRLIAFAGAGDDGQAATPVGQLCSYLLESPASPLKLFTPAGADVDAVFDLRAVFQQSHHTLAVTAMPELLFPPKGRHGLRDYEKAFCAVDDAKQNIYDMRGINKKSGCLVVVRPDQYIAQVWSLGHPDALADALSKFFAGFMLEAHKE